MKILWIVNVPLPEVCTLLNIANTPYGGWLINASKYLACEDGIELHIAFPHCSNTKLIHGEEIVYHGFKVSKSNKLNVIFFENCIKEINPDLIHLFGTELPHAFPLVQAANSLNVKVVVSIQGLVSIINRYLFADLPLSVVYGMTLRNLLNFDSIYFSKKLLESRGKKEELLLKGVSNVIGRTKWDRTCVANINNKAKYFHCNETLRKSFYQSKWNINSISRHKIFISQGHYSLKGIHYVLEAIFLLKNEYPNLEVCIGGKNIIEDDKIFGISLRTKYAEYVKTRINRLELSNYITFLGTLDETDMIHQYLDSHVYICPSTIENSPNSLGEAMILGVPCIASFVGGIPDLLQNDIEGILYQHNAPYMLATAIKDIFSNDDLALTFSKNSIKRAQTTHNEIINNKQLMSIYTSVTNGE